MTADEFLTLRGVNLPWLEGACSDLSSGDAEGAEDILGLLAEMLCHGAPLPPSAASLVSCILQDIASGLDARERVGTKPKRGAPKNDVVAEKHRQAYACIVLLKLAGIRPTNAAELVALATPMDSGEIWHLPTEAPVGKWGTTRYFAEIGFGKDGNGVLRRLIENRPNDPKLLKHWEQFADFCTVNQIR